MRALALEPLADADFVIGAGEIADHQAQEVQSLRDLVRGGSGSGPVAAEAAGRNAQEAAEQLQAERAGQPAPFKLRDRRLLDCEIQRFQGPFQTRCGSICRIQADIPADAGAMTA